MILARDKNNNTDITFDNINLFNQALELEPGRFELKQSQFEEPKDIEVIDVEEIKVDEPTIDQLGLDDVEEVKPVLIHKDELKEYTVKSFRSNLDNFSNAELEVFAKFDERQTIVKEARKELNRRG